ncbi:MAG: prepilin-type N-terminal cleavage/methylation domain-containing protein [Patescibacteria group bacterium]
MTLPNTNRRRPTNQGYTLLEAIIYLAVLTVLAMVFISLLFSMTQTYTEFRLTRAIASSALLGLERLTREIKQATSLDLVTSNLGAHPGRLVLNTTTADGTPTTIDFYLSAGSLMVKEGSNAAASTTAALVTVDNLIFQSINAAESVAVKIELTLSASRGQLSRAEKFYATAVLRGSY